MSDLALGPVLAQGRTASVHGWRPGQVLKLFRPEFDRGAVEREANIARAVRAAGAPAPAVGDIVAINGRFGLVYERVVGVRMSDVLLRQPWRAASLGRRLARLQASMHALQAPATLPSLHDELHARIERARQLPRELRGALLQSLADLAPGDSLCHGDFHPANVLLGPVCDMVIDWTDAARGPRMADVARTAVILLGAAQLVPRRTPAARTALGRFHAAYLAEYRRLAHATARPMHPWRPIVAAARLAEGIHGLAPWLQSQARQVMR